VFVVQDLLRHSVRRRESQRIKPRLGVAGGVYLYVCSPYINRINIIPSDYLDFLLFRAGSPINQ